MSEPSLRVAVVAYHFPPSRAVGAQRPARWVAELRSRGLEVQVITARLQAEAGDGRHPEAEQWVHDVPVRWNPRRFWATLKRTLGGGRELTRQPAAPTAASKDNPPRSMPFLLRQVDAWFWLPDDHQGFIWPAARKVIALHRARPFDAIYVSGPPFSAHVAGVIAARRTGVPLWVEYRDPWLEGREKQTEAWSAPAAQVERMLQQRSLVLAQGVVAVTPTIAATVKAKLPATEHAKVTVVYNGIPSLTPNAEPRPPLRRQLTLLHAGTLYLGRDPRALLGGLAALHRTGRIDPASVHLLLVGHSRYFGGVSVRAMADELQLDGMVELRDTVSATAAGELMRNADVLILLAQRQPAQVPQKLFDYLGTRKPILAFVDRGGETDRLLRQVGGHVVIANGTTMDEVGEAVEEVLRLAREGGQRGTPEVLEGLTLARQLGALANRFVARVKSPPTPGRIPGIIGR